MGSPDDLPALFAGRRDFSRHSVVEVVAAAVRLV